MSETSQGAREPFDDRAEIHRKSGDLLAAIARRHSHVDIDTVTLERWRELMGLTREVDTWADNTDATRDEVIEALRHFELFRERYPSLAPEALGADAHEALLTRANRILRVGEFASRTLSVRRFVALRAIEGRETVNMLSDTATPYVAGQSAFSEEFLPAARALGEAGTLWDSVIDGWQDIRDGKQQLRPNAEYYAQLTGGMLQRIKLGGAALLHYEPNRIVAVKAWERLGNRVRNGIPEYSSLARFTRQRNRD